MKNTILITGFLVLMLLPGCLVYHPMPVDIPLISEKNDLRIDAGVSLVPAAFATVSYGLTDKIAVQGYGSIGSDERYYFQSAAGWYKKDVNNLVYEIYGGFGYGYGDAYRDANPGDLTGDYQLYFGQFNFGKISGKTSNFEAGLAIKAGYLRSELTDKNYYSWISETGPFITYNDESVILEPCGFIRVGGDKIKLNIKIGSTLMYKFTHKDKSIPYSRLNLGIGLNFRL